MNHITWFLLSSTLIIFNILFHQIKNKEGAPPVSIGFPGYVYPDESSCEMYQGVSCSNNSTQCCYNEELWCPTEDNCRVDNGAYPFGDHRQYSNQMTDPYALSPFPNAILFNWATIFVLGFGNLAGKHLNRHFDQFIS